jgi:hypothetical protein
MVDRARKSAAIDALMGEPLGPSGQSGGGLGLLEAGKTGESDDASDGAGRSRPRSAGGGSMG